MALHPDCVAYMKRAEAWFAARKLPAFWDMPALRARQAFLDFVRDSKPPLAELAERRDMVIPTRGGARPARLYRPKVAAGDAPLPIALYFFGGGYVIGGLDESEAEARRIAQRTPAIVIGFGYRLAPEHRFPAAVEDGFDALGWVAANAAALGGDANRLMVGGCSAGGGLGAAVARLAAEAGGPSIALAFLFCPWLDLTLSQPSVATFARGFDLDREFLDWFVQAYIGDSGKAADPLASPGRHAPPAGHAPVAILAAECDPLVDEARAYRRRLQQAGVPVAYSEALGMVHAFNEITHLIPAGDALLRPIEAAMRAV